MAPKVVGIMVCLFLLAISVASKSVIVGDSGSSTTRFCNLYDGRKCGDEKSKRSLVESSHFGRLFINTNGFRIGDVNDDGAFGRALRATKIANDLNGETVESIVWMVPCSDISNESIVDLRVQSYAVGKNVPVVAVVDPGVPGAVCKRSNDELLSLMASKNVSVREVINIDDFDVEAHQAKYTQSFQVSLPGDLDDLHIESAKEDTANSENKQAKQCSMDKRELAEVRKKIARIEEGIKNDPPVVECPPPPPCAAAASAEECAQRSCLKGKETCTKVNGITVKCSTECEKWENSPSGFCPDERFPTHSAFLENCEELRTSVFEFCTVLRKKQLDHIDTSNAMLGVLLKKEQEEEARLVEATKCCGGVVGTCTA